MGCQKLFRFAITLSLAAFFGFNIFVLDLYTFLEIGKINDPHDEGCFVKPGIFAAEDQTRWNDNSALTGSADRSLWSQQKDGDVPQGSIWAISGFKKSKI